MPVHLENRMYFIPPDIEKELKSLVKDRYLSNDAAVHRCVTHGDYVLRAMASEFQLRSFASEADKTGSLLDLPPLSKQYDGEPVALPLSLSQLALDKLANLAIDFQYPPDVILAWCIAATRILLTAISSKAPIWICDTDGRRIRHVVFISI